ncbi:MAG: outer membrane lipoprotein-sorting protein [Spirochaetes bacterium]|nr:outer membrane lipoprotein-sorting protein [Spirochaetota bacterium]
MNKYVIRNVLLLLFLPLIPVQHVFARNLTGEEIIKKMEANQVQKSARLEGVFIITDKFGERKKTFKLVSLGTDRTLLEFTNPEEAGQKILRAGDEIYLYFPEAEDVIHLKGSALRDSVLGSDFSYEDLTGEKGLLDIYDVEAEGMETVNGRECYTLKLTAKNRKAVYPGEKLWVDSELFVLRKAYYYALSGRLIKEMEIRKVIKVKGKNIPVWFVMEDRMKKDSRTTFIINNIQIDVPVDPGIFSLEELSW